MNSPSILEDIFKLCLIMNKKNEQWIHETPFRRVFKLPAIVSINSKSDNYGRPI